MSNLTQEDLDSMSPLAIAGVKPYVEKDGEEYMNDAQKEHFRKILTAWRDQLRSEVDRTVGHMKNEAANFPDPVDREEYMNDAQKEHFRKILTAWRDQLRSEVDRTVGHMKNEAANFPDPVDRASQEEEFALELRARDRERKLIKKIEKTLRKLDDDEFGFCEQCGIEIGIKRLEARPTADLCVDCKSLAEIKEKQYGD